MCMGIVKSCPGGGRSCLAGWLGGLEPIPDFNPLLQMASGAYLTFLAVSSSERRAFSDVPLQQIAAGWRSRPAQRQANQDPRFEEIREAHRVMEANEAPGVHA
jgi:NADPH:quinone reductase